MTARLHYNRLNGTTTGALVAAAVVSGLAGVSSAATYSTPFSPPTLVTSYTNTLTGADPVWQRPVAGGTETQPAPATSLGTGTTFPYQTFAFTPATTGVYEFYSAQAHDGYLLLYNNPFNAATPLVNNIAGDDDMSSLNGGAVPNRNGVPTTNDSGFRIPLTGGNNYTVVTTTFSSSVPASGLYYNEIYNTNAQAIPDAVVSNVTPGAPLVMTLNVADHGAIQSFDSVLMRGLKHTFVGDLVVTLTHVESGKTVDIIDRHNRLTTSATDFGYGGDFNGDYTFVDVGTPLPTTGATVAPGTYMTDLNPSPGGNSAFNSPMSLFAGDDVFGTWQLSLTDWGQLDIGLLSAFAINVTIIPEPASMSGLALAAVGLIGRRRRH
jgi:hypothetical protein